MWALILALVLLFGLVIATLVFQLIHYYRLKQDLNHTKDKIVVDANVPRLTPLMKRLAEVHWKSSEEVPLVGLLIEPRPHPHLWAVLENFHTVFPDVPVVWLYGNLNVPTESQLDQADYILPFHMKLDNLDIPMYNCILTQPDLYRILPGRYVLTFQTDSVLFTACKKRLEDYIDQYDYIGAPWRSNKGFGAIRIGNGGLSLRNRDKCLELTERYPPLSCSQVPESNEDVYFAYMMHQYGRVPTVDVARNIFYEYLKPTELPIGAHKFLPPSPWCDQLTEQERAILIPH